MRYGNVVKYFLVLGLFGGSLLGHECRTEDKTLVLRDDIEIQRTDVRYGYRDLSCRDIREIYFGYERDENKRTILEIKDEANTTGLIIQQGEVFALKRSDAHFTIAVDMNKTIFDTPKSMDTKYYSSDREKYYYLYTFTKKGSLIPHGIPQIITLHNTTKSDLTLDEIFEDVTWFDKNLSSLAQGDEQNITLKDSINLKLQKDIASFVKVEKKNNTIILSFKELFYVLKAPMQKVLNPKSMPDEKPVKIETLDIFKKIKNDMIPMMRDNICIQEKSFETDRFEIQLKYCKINSTKLTFEPSQYSDAYDLHKIKAFYGDKPLVLEEAILYLGDKIDINVSLDNSLLFTFNQENSNENTREKQKRISLEKQTQQRVQIYPTFKKQEILFECSKNKIDVNKKVFKGKKKTTLVTTKELTLPGNRGKVKCGTTKEIVLDKNESIEIFIEGIKGYGVCRQGSREHKIAALCAKEKNKLFIAYIPFSKKQFLKYLKGDIPEHLIVLRKFMTFLRDKSPKQYGNLYIKSTQKDAKVFNGQYFKENIDPNKTYKSIEKSIEHDIYNVFDVGGEIALVYFSDLDRDQINERFCQSGFQHKVIVLNFNEDIDSSRLCTSVKLYNIANGKKIDIKTLQDKLQDIQENVLKDLKEK